MPPMRRVVRNLTLLPFTALVAAAAQSPGLASASGIYNSSQTPPTLPWNTYNFCNAPHVNAAHYELPPQAVAADPGSARLLHVSVVMRHHKVRPPLHACTETRKGAHSARRTTSRRWSVRSARLWARRGTAWARCSSRTTSAVRRSRTARRRPRGTHSRARCGAGRATRGNSRPAGCATPRATARCAPPLPPAAHVGPECAH